MLTSRTTLPHLLAIVLLCCGVTRAATPAVNNESPELTLESLTLEMQTQVEKLRGWKFKHNVASHLCGATELEAFIRRGFDEGARDGSLSRKEAGVQLVGLIPADCSLVKTASTMFAAAAAFYDHETGEVYVLQREGATLGSYMQRVSLLHELVHALDDQHLDINMLHERGEASTDASFVVGSLLEGSAIIIQSTYMMIQQTAGQFSPDDMQKEMTEEIERQQAFFEAPPYFTKFSAQFPCGSAFLRRGAGASFLHPPKPEEIGNALKQATGQLPRSSEQMLHPDKYWDAEERDEPVIIDDDAISQIVQAAKLEVVDTDTFGELLCAMLARPADETPSQMGMMSTKAWTNEAATGWGGDRFYLLARTGTSDPAGKFKGIWLTAWDTPADCDEFTAAYEKHRDLPHRSRVQLGNRCTCWLFGLDPQEAKAITECITDGSLAFSQAQQPWHCDAES